MEYILQIKNLHVHYIKEDETVKAVNGINLNLKKGESVGLVGETGAGKTTAALSVMGLIPYPPGLIIDGEIIYEGRNIINCSNKEYPHQFSGGMKQRVVIAMSLLLKPKILIADEPTTALDVTIQAQVLNIINNLREKFDMSLILITHDLGVVAQVCDRVSIMYAGEIVESGYVKDVYLNTKHPYTKGLFNSIPRLDTDNERLVPIEGDMVNPANLPSGCYFNPRCKYRKDICIEKKPDIIGDNHQYKCHF